LEEARAKVESIKAEKLSRQLGPNDVEADAMSNADLQCAQNVIDEEEARKIRKAERRAKKKAEKAAKLKALESKYSKNKSIKVKSSKSQNRSTNPESETTSAALESHVLLPQTEQLPSFDDLEFEETL